MKFLIVDTGLAFEVARRLKEEGHNVRYFNTWKRVSILPEDILYMEGLYEYYGIERVDAWLNHVDWADIIVFTDVNFGKEKDWLREKGYPVFGASEKGEALEIDRKAGDEAFKEIGLKIIPKKTFKNPQEAIQFVKDGGKEKKWVIRLASGLETDLPRTLVTQYPDEVEFWLESFMNKGYEDKIILQEVVEGVEVSVGGFFDGEKWVSPPCIVFEEKRSYEGGMGPLCGETGSTLYFGDEGKFIEAVFKPMEKYLRKIKAGAGNYDINTIVSYDGKIYPLEFTARFGFPTIYIQHPLVSDFGKFLDACVNKKEYKGKIRTDWAVGICWCAGIHPYSELSEKIVGLPIFGVEECLKFKYGDNKYLALDSLMYKDKKFVLSPSPGRTVTCVGIGERLEEARQNALELAQKIYIPDGYYRRDIGERVFVDQEILNDLGMLKKEV